MGKQSDLSSEMRQVVKMIRAKKTRRQIARELDVTVWKARQLIAEANVIIEGVPKAGMDPNEPIFRSEVLRKIKRPTTVAKLAEQLNSSEDDINSVIEDLEERGYVIHRVGTTISIGKSIEQEAQRIVFENHYYDKPIKFGVVADMHMCSKSDRLDVLNAAYDEFKRQEIDTVLCPGNYVDGECRFNIHELKARGIADQCQYAIDNWPHKEGIKTYYVDGDDHEGWWCQREGIEFGRYLMLEAQAQGRDDLVYMGYMEADIELRALKGSAIVKVIHAGGGSSYAFSYASQKLVESFQGGEKPAVAIIGHYHKMEYCYPRSVHCVQAGCCQDQTRFMRKRKLAAHVGFSIITLQQDIKGSVTRFCPEFFPFFDKGYYLNRDNVGNRLKGKPR